MDDFDIKNYKQEFLQLIKNEHGDEMQNYQNNYLKFLDGGKIWNHSNGNCFLFIRWPFKYSIPDFKKIKIIHFHFLVNILETRK